MNIIKILLILGLGYVALNQKVVKTRNMLLVVTGLLAFCMFSIEGFSVDLSSLSIFSGSNQTVSGRSITVASSDPKTQIVYTLPATGNYDSSQDIPDTGYSCTIGDSPGKIGKSSDPTYNTANTLSTAVTDNSVDITKIFTCAAASDGNSQSCADGKTALKKTCPDFYSVKADTNCASDPCVVSEFSDTGTCCEKSCDDSKCTNWTILGLDAPKDGKMCKKDIFGLLQYYCEN